MTNANPSRRDVAIRLAVVAIVAATLLAGAGSTFAQTPKVIGPRDLNPEAARPVEMITPLPVDVARSRTLDWVAAKVEGDRARLEAIGMLWGQLGDAPTREQLFQTTIRAFMLADPATQAFIESCGLQRPPLLPPEAQLLEKQEAGSFYLANLGLYFGRYLVQRQMFEEALTVLEKVPVAEVVDPATLLFNKAVCQHHLLRKAEGLATVDQILRGLEGVPVRYTTIATLMQYDLEALEENSLDEISRKMTDVERRLNLGRAGQKVQKKEDEIIATLDEIIKKKEEQQGGGGGGGGGQSNQSQAPAGDSVVKGSTAPGKVDPKKLEKGGDWGDLPPRARAKAKDLIAREFPAHYRSAIDEFTRKEANRTGSGK